MSTTTTVSEPVDARPSPASSRALTFLVLAIAGLLGQLALFGAFVADQGFDPAEFADQAVGSTIAGLALADLMMCVLVYLVWMPREAARAGIRRWWPFAVATLGGLCFAFPLFLYARESQSRRRG
jgi:hypothetical protein